MKHLIFVTLVAALAFWASPVLAQTTAKPKTTKKTTKSTRASTAHVNANADADAAVDNPVHSETTDDRLYLNHPFFNGEPRWTHVDSLYKHGDFPWALVSKNPDNFRFNPESGQWEMLETPNLGKAAPTR